jgi:hypothetical protein
VSESEKLSNTNKIVEKREPSFLIGWEPKRDFNLYPSEKESYNIDDFFDIVERREPEEQATLNIQSNDSEEEEEANDFIPPPRKQDEQLPTVTNYSSNTPSGFGKLISTNINNDNSNTPTLPPIRSQGSNIPKNNETKKRNSLFL